MKQSVILILSLLLLGTSSFSQSRRTIRVKAGEDMAQAYSKQGFYRFPQFKEAIVYFKDGTQNQGTKLNYNILDGTMQFINKSGDTLNMSPNNNTDSVVFDGTVFYYHDENFLEVAGQANDIKLLKKILIKKQIENIGAYGQANPTASIENLKNYNFGTNVFSFIINQDIVVFENISWFVAGPGNHIQKASKTNFLKLLPAGQQSDAETFIKKNKINFEREDDLKKLISSLK